MRGEAPKGDRALIGLLQYGTGAASGLVAVGMVLQGAAGTAVITGGILLFILLPVCRVVLMLAGFAKERDYRFVAIAVLVLVIIGVSYWVGAARPRVSPTPVPGGRLLRTG